MNNPENNDNNSQTSQVSFGSAESGETSLQPPAQVENDADSVSKGPKSSAGALGNLYSITRELHAVENAIIESNGELPPEIEERFSAALIAREKKIDAYHAIMLRCDLIEAQYKAQIEILSKISKAAKLTKARLKTSLKEAMHFLGVSELQGNETRFKLSEGKPRVEIENENLIPFEYLKEKTVLVPNLERIETMLKAGENVPGCKLTHSSTLRTYPAKKG